MARCEGREPLRSGLITPIYEPQRRLVLNGERMKKIRGSYAFLLPRTNDHPVG